MGFLLRFFNYFFQITYYPFRLPQVFSSPFALISRRSQFVNKSFKIPLHNTHIFSIFTVYHITIQETARQFAYKIFFIILGLVILNYQLSSLFRTFYTNALSHLRGCVFLYSDFFLRILIFVSHPDISPLVLFHFPFRYGILDLFRKPTYYRPWQVKEVMLMPGFTTHYLFGVKAFNDLPNNYLKHVISKYRWLYQLGLQGPDIFFYNIPNLRHRDYRSVGSNMHDSRVNDFFRTCLAEIADISSKQQREQAIAYFAGYLCHYVADSVCHPYVYGRIQNQAESRGLGIHGLHAQLENDIDAILLWKFKKKKPSEFNQTATLCLNSIESQFIARFLSRCINRTYYADDTRHQFQVTNRMIAFSIFAIRFGSRILSDPSGRKQTTVRAVESVFIPHGVASKKLVTDHKPEDIRWALNLDHEVWVNPWNKRLASIESFVDLYNRTLQKCCCLYHELSLLLTGETPLVEADWSRFLAEAGNFSYHSGLDVDEYPKH